MPDFVELNQQNSKHWQTGPVMGVLLSFYTSVADKIVRWNYHHYKQNRYWPINK